MKITHILLAAVLAATSAVQAATAEHKLPAPLPEFKTPEQLAVWRQEMTEKTAAGDALAAKQANSALPISHSKLTEETSVFYTGKPYLEETGSYTFKFRQYDPELSRWTSADPSGFPDGANNGVYTSSPLSICDPTGKTNKSVVWISCYYHTSDPDAYSMYLEVSGVTAQWRNIIAGYDTNSANTGSPTHYLDDGDTFTASSIGALSDLSAFSGYTEVYVFAHGVFDINLPNNPFRGFGVGGTIYQAGDFYNAASNVMWVDGCTEWNNGLGNTTTDGIANNFINPTMDHLYE